MLLIRNKRLRQAAGILETVNLLFLKLAWKNPAAARLYPGKVFRDYMSLGGEGQWISKSFFELFPEASAIRIILECSQGNGIYTPIDELAYLALLTRILKPSRVFEIGTFRGRTALNFALNSPPDCTVHTLYLPHDGHLEAVEETNVADARLIQLSSPGIDYAGKESSEKILQLC